MIEENNFNNVIQNIILENREKLNVSGVTDVLSFDDQLILIETQLGLLSIKGEKLKINKINLDTEEAIIDGFVQSLIYSNNEINNKKKSIIEKIFK